MMILDSDLLFCATLYFDAKKLNGEKLGLCPSRQSVILLVFELSTLWLIRLFP